MSATRAVRVKLQMRGAPRRAGLRHPAGLHGPPRLAAVLRDPGQRVVDIGADAEGTRGAGVEGGHQRQTGIKADLGELLVQRMFGSKQGRHLRRRQGEDNAIEHLGHA
jgi:hypothetical protein